MIQLNTVGELVEYLTKTYRLDTSIWKRDDGDLYPFTNYDMELIEETNEEGRIEVVLAILGMEVI